MEGGEQHKEDAGSPPGQPSTGNRSGPPGPQETREQKWPSRATGNSGTEAVLQDCRELRNSSPPVPQRTRNRSSPPGLQRTQNRSSPPGLQRTQEQKQSSRTADPTHDEGTRTNTLTTQTDTLALTGRRNLLK
ncbi:hypothetical protein D4764_06G0008280 [Takifugu flavidus]|uniref:Uncharacterized protein n=1 Tax=Takifugu flavidus TaxID=433684 RepID=A0A5C6MY22_9TELE|nr:hypothetical protein D4764_06G0008280 [Takifugu flavidus]